MSSRNTYRKLGLINGLKTTNLVANSSLTTSYNLVLPSATPTIAGQSLISDTSGNLSWGSSTGTISTFTGTTNPLTTATNVTGLTFTSSFNQVNVYVTVNATTNIYALYTLKVYQKGSSSSWGLAYDADCDTDDTDPQVVFTVTSAGQIQYTLPNTITGFASVVMLWSLGTAISNTLTSLALSSNFSVAGTSNFTAAITGTSLALSSTLYVSSQISGSTISAAVTSGSGTVSGTAGAFFSVLPQTYTDTTTAASSTASGTFSATYLGIPTLAATNTVVTTTTASTVTIAGAPLAGTNETLTNAYALNILSGSVYLGGQLQYKKPSYVLYGWAGNTSQTIAAGTTTALLASQLKVVRQSADNLLTNVFSGSTITITVAGMYACQWYARTGNSSSNTGFIEYWVTWNGPGIQIAHNSGYGTIGSTLPFSMPCAVGDTFQLLANSSAANTFNGGIGSDHSLMINLLYLM